MRNRVNMAYALGDNVSPISSIEYERCIVVVLTQEH